MPPSSERTREPPAISNIPSALVPTDRFSFCSSTSLHQRNGQREEWMSVGKHALTGMSRPPVIVVGQQFVGTGIARTACATLRRATQATAISPEEPDPCNERLLMHVLRSELAVHRQCAVSMPRSEWRASGSIGVASGEWRVASGEWRVASGYRSGEWRVASGEWRVASREKIKDRHSHRSALFSPHSPLATPISHSPLATRHLPLATFHSPLATRHSPLATVRTMPFRSHPDPALLPRY